jgi:hypothetical protein
VSDSSPLTSSSPRRLSRIRKPPPYLAKHYMYVP